MVEAAVFRHRLVELHHPGHVRRRGHQPVILLAGVPDGEIPGCGVPQRKAQAWRVDLDVARSGGGLLAGAIAAIAFTVVVVPAARSEGEQAAERQQKESRDQGPAPPGDDSSL
ncbi:MAG: hypothetical protein U5Q44_16755 [Dehalococcoidia bacterium]|nr:hypothetical protein [Dehalococcoidia bacterium]